MTYRPARRPEFVEALCDLTALKSWRRYVWCAQALYGPHAGRVVVRAEWRDVPPPEGDEMDEPGSEAYITDITVYDQQGRQLAPDLRLPHWQERIDKLGLAVLAGNAREAAITGDLREAYDQLPIASAGSKTYRVGTPPAPQWPPLYVGGDGQPFRPASEEDMELGVWDIVTSNTWEFFTKFTRDVYGRRAARIDVTGKCMELDPDVWTMQVRKPRAEVVAAVVADADRNRLTPDLSTQWWQEWFQGRQVITMAEAERADAIAQAEQTYLSWWPSMETEQETYWLDRLPARRGPILYVREPFEPLSDQAPRR